MKRFRDWFERFRKDAGHTVLGICRCDLCEHTRLKGLAGHTNIRGEN